MKIVLWILILNLWLVPNLFGQEHLEALSSKEIELVKRYCKSEGDDYVKMYLFSDLEEVAKGGKIKVGILFEIADGMNIYGPEKSAVNYPTSIELKLPQGVKLEHIDWQMPVEVRDGKKGYMEYCIAVANLVVDANIAIKNVEVQTEVSFQVCDELYCRQGEIKNGLSFSIGKDKKTKVVKIFNK